MTAGYFNVQNGCAGDMLAASIAGICGCKFLEKELKKISLSNIYEIKLIPVKRELPSSHSFSANQFIVSLKNREKPNSYTEIKKIFETSNFKKSVKSKILEIFSIIAKAESKIHKEPLDKIHFHQVGQTDALVEIASVVILLDFLKIEKIYSSPVGLAKPAPATIEISKGLPVNFKNGPFEITTPTGMAIIKGIVDEFSDTPPMKIIDSSYGTGTNEKIQPNTVLFSYGECNEEIRENLGIIETSIDDMNPVIFEHLMEKLYKQGALEVSFFTGMTKKSRPMFNLRILCFPDKKDSLMEIVFKETSSIGIRYRKEERYPLKREEKIIKTAIGEIPIKVGYFNEKIVNISPEYEVCKKIAAEQNMPLKKVLSEIMKKFNF
ncbi:MAG: LarC family nickel insertion protein [Candidatus Omnitrophica bacterium]|nr:LarC family nickel insertion protein [Candidatus Omnitrophota bacterium]